MERLPEPPGDCQDEWLASNSGAIEGNGKTDPRNEHGTMTDSNPKWQPDHVVELVAGTPAGGGQDRPARALIDVLQSKRLLDQPMKLVNIPGRGGGNAWDHLETRRGDPHVLAINSPTIISNRLLGVSGLAYDDLTPIANLYTESIAFLVGANSSLRDGRDLLSRLRDAGRVRVTLATAIGNSNHVALAKVTQHVGGDVTALPIEVFDSARFAIAHLLEERAELAVVTAASAVPELKDGRLRCLAVSAPKRLGGLFAAAPTLLELGVDCETGMWRGVIAPAGIGAAAISFWEEKLAAATGSAEWQAELARQYWTSTYLVGQDLAQFLAAERALTTKMLGDLGLCPAKIGEA
jgi:putative tricarboxylic transport membrane protein